MQAHLIMNEIFNRSLILSYLQLLFDSNVLSPTSLIASPSVKALGRAGKEAILDGIGLILPLGNKLLRYRNWERRCVLTFPLFSQACHNYTLFLNRMKSKKFRPVNYKVYDSCMCEEDSCEAKDASTTTCKTYVSRSSNFFHGRLFYSRCDSSYPNSFAHRSTVTLLYINYALRCNKLRNKACTISGRLAPQALNQSWNKNKALKRKTKKMKTGILPYCVYPCFQV